MSKINKFFKMDYINNVVLESEEGVELVFSPHTKYIQIAMGGEIWSGYIDVGTNILRHPRESMESEYAPVIVIAEELEEEGDAIEFKISGGFGTEATFIIGQNFPRNNFH